MNIQAAVDAPRFHHQWLPDQLQLERRADQADLIQSLEKMGHQVRGAKQGDAHSIWIDPQTGEIHGAADRRIMGHALGY